jgi:hypothetical protein
MMCPHGDRTCPCQDGDPCHYEGEIPMLCPNPPGPKTVSGGGVIQKLDEQLRPIGPPMEYSQLTTYEWDARNPHCHVERCKWHTEAKDISTEGTRYRELGVCELNALVGKMLAQVLPLDPDVCAQHAARTSEATASLPWIMCGAHRMTLYRGT